MEMGTGNGNVVKPEAPFIVEWQWKDLIEFHHSMSNAYLTMTCTIYV